MDVRMQSPEYVIFRRPHLVLALCQLRYPVLPRFPDPDYVDDFYQAVRDVYPKSNRTSQMAFPLLADSMAAHLASSSLLWRFSSVDDHWSIVLTETAVTLESRRYTSIEEFTERFLRVIGWITEVLKPGLQTRLGLRYINEFRIPTASTLGDWHRYIKQEVLGLSGITDELFPDSSLAFARQEMEISFPGSSLVVRHGLLSGTTVEAPDSTQVTGAPQAQGPFYLLDMDSSDSSTRAIDAESISAQLAGFNTTMYRFFRWAILPPLFEALEPSDGG